MIGLIVLFVIGVYLAVSILVIIWAAEFAKRKGRSPWLGGILAALFMYLIVFWDHIPTKIMYRHYCNKEAGVWIYKTVEQWKKENPGVSETLKPYTDKNRPAVTYAEGEQIKEFLNPRFLWVVRKIGPVPVNIFRTTNEIVDTKTGEVMARQIVFSSGYGNPLLSAQYGIKSYKVWLVEDRCPCYYQKHIQYSEYRDSIENIGGK